MLHSLVLRVAFSALLGFSAHLCTLQYSLDAVGDFSNRVTASLNSFFASSSLPTDGR